MLLQSDLIYTSVLWSPQMMERWLCITYTWWPTTYWPAALPWIGKCLWEKKTDDIDAADCLMSGKADAVRSRRRGSKTCVHIFEFSLRKYVYKHFHRWAELCKRSSGGKILEDELLEEKRLAAPSTGSCSHGRQALEKTSVKIKRCCAELLPKLDLIPELRAIDQKAFFIVK